MAEEVAKEKDHISRDFLKPSLSTTLTHEQWASCAEKSKLEQGKRVNSIKSE